MWKDLSVCVITSFLSGHNSSDWARKYINCFFWKIHWTSGVLYLKLNSHDSHLEKKKRFEVNVHIDKKC